MVAKSLILGLILLPGASWAQDGTAPRPSSDIYLYSSADPLTRRVMSAQLADRQSGGVVSSVLLAPASSSPTGQAKVEVKGAATSAEGLALPASTIRAAYRDSRAMDDLRDAVAPKRAKISPASRFLKRSLAAEQLQNVVEQMNRAAEKASADKAWDKGRIPPSRHHSKS